MLSASFSSMINISLSLIATLLLVPTFHAYVPASGHGSSRLLSENLRKGAIASSPTSLCVHQEPLINADSLNNIPSPRRQFLLSLATTSFFWSARGAASRAATTSYPPIDVNNAMAREFTAFPGLYPTIGTKIVKAAKEKNFTSKKDVYAALDTDTERERLRLYDSSIQIKKVDKALQQFKGSQICKYECGSRVSSSFRDDQIKSVQKARAVGN